MGLLYSHSPTDAGAFENHHSIPCHNVHANIDSLQSLECCDSTLTELIIDCGCGNDPNLKAVNFSSLKQVRCIEIGNHSFKYATLCKAYRMPELRRFIVGDSCFVYVKEKDDYAGLDNLLRGGGLRCGFGFDDYDGRSRYDDDCDEYGNRLPNGKLAISRCLRLKEIRIGAFSFADYYACEIKELPSLTTLAIGDADPAHRSANFWKCSLRVEGLMLMI